MRFIPIEVGSYSGYKSDEYPRFFYLREEKYEIGEEVDCWYQGERDPELPLPDYKPSILVISCNFNKFGIMKRLLLVMFFTMLFFSCEREKEECYDCEIITTFYHFDSINGPHLIMGPTYKEVCGTDQEIDAYEEANSWEKTIVPGQYYNHEAVSALVNCHNN